MWFCVWQRSHISLSLFLVWPFRFNSVIVSSYFAASSLTSLHSFCALSNYSCFFPSKYVFWLAESRSLYFLVFISIFFIFYLNTNNIKINSFRTNSCLKKSRCPNNCSHTSEIKKNIVSFNKTTDRSSGKPWKWIEAIVMTNIYVVSCFKTICLWKKTYLLMS